MALFVADPAVLGQEGRHQSDLKENFVRNQEKMKNTVTEMLSSAYISPAARAQGEQIASYDDVLNAMAETIGDYADYCMRAGNKVTKNEEDIIDSIKPKTNVNIDMKG